MRIFDEMHKKQSGLLDRLREIDKHRDLVNRLPLGIRTLQCEDVSTVFSSWNDKLVYIDFDCRSRGENQDFWRREPDDEAASAAVAHLQRYGVTFTKDYVLQSASEDMWMRVGSITTAGGDTAEVKVWGFSRPIGYEIEYETVVEESYTREVAQVKCSFKG